MLNTLRARCLTRSSASSATTSPRTATPTYSWLNWIETEFAGRRYFALNGTDHRSHAEQNAAIAGSVRWGSTRATPKVNFATDPPIRTRTHYAATTT